MVGGMYSLTVAAILALLSCSSAGWLDMTYNFDNQTIYWPRFKPFTHTLVHKGMSHDGYYFATYDISAAEHGGTHIDAPIHFYEGKSTLDQVPLDDLIGPAVVVDISEKAAKDPDYQLSVKDLEEWEKANGKIPDGAIVLLFSGWGKYWPDNSKFMRNDPGNTTSLHFPGFHPEAAKWLVKSGKVKAVGSDTASLDHGQSKEYKAHIAFFKANIPGFEMVANLDKLPASGATVYAAPMKIKDGSGGPTRIFANLEKQQPCSTKRTKITWHDMTYSFSNETIYWPGSTTFTHTQIYKPNKTRDGFYLIMYEYSAAEHGGTHLDSPIHFSEGKWSTHDIPLDNLIGPAVKVDISKKAASNSSYQLMPSDMEDWEQEHGKVPEGVILLVYTGWGNFYPDRSKYMGMQPGGNVSLHFPGIHPDTATWMVKRKLKAVGLDTASLDYGQSKDFKTHQILFKANIPGFENVANLETLPGTGATIFAAPMKIKDGSGGPLRIFAKLGGECQKEPTSGGGRRALIGHVITFIIVLFVLSHITF